MKFTRIYILIIFLITFGITNAQEPDFGKVSELELKSAQDPNFPDANAIVLYRHVNNFLGNYVEVHERIKIYNKEGFDEATIFIPYADVGRVKGATYNMVDGEIVETPLDKDLIFEDEVIKDVEFKKFTFPNVKEGSVLEYKYKTDKGSSKNIDLQYDIPIKNEKVVVTNRMQLGIEILQNPRAYLNVNRVQSGNSTIFKAKNVPALESENFVYDMDMYRSYITMNLTSIANEVNFYNWESLAGNIVGVDDFGQGAKPKRFYKDDVAAAIGDKIDNLEKAKAIYDFLKSKVKWNKEYWVIPDENIRKVYDDEEGNIAAINILYVSMLKSVGIEAYPLLSSTKLNGIPITASLSSFNTTLAYLKIGANEYVVDVAHPKSTFNYIGTQFLNWKGIKIDQKDKSFGWVQLDKVNPSAKSIITNATLSEDLIVSGTVKERLSGYFAANANSKLKDLAENDKKRIVDYEKSGLYITDINTKNDSPDIVDVSFNFEMENAIDEISDKMYINPLLFFTIDENPFKKEERKYAIDFGFPFKEQSMITLSLPEGYVVESLPEPSKMVMEDIGSYTIRTNAVGDKIQIMGVFEIQNALLPFDKYPQIQQFFKLRLEKEQEKIVLTKA